MSTYVIEIKKLRGASLENAASSDFEANNLTGTASGSWVTIISSVANSYALIVTNTGNAAINIAQSSDTTPLRYWVVPAGSQRILVIRADQGPVKVKNT